MVKIFGTTRAISRIAPLEAAVLAVTPRTCPCGAWVSPRSPRLSLLSPAGIDVAHLCRNSGLCVDTGNTHFCRCQAGYTGSYCEEQVDECSPNPCQNGATCTDYLGGYSCEVSAAGDGDVQGEKHQLLPFCCPRSCPSFRLAQSPFRGLKAGVLAVLLQPSGN